MKAAGRSVRGQHVLVTGGAGFIGSHLVDALLAEGAGRVTAVDNFYLGKHENLAAAQRHAPDLAILPLDASDYTGLRAAIERLPEVDAVFDLAVVPLPASLEQPRMCFDTNARITSTLCELLREGLFRTLVHFSSSEAYGSAQMIPMSEQPPLEPLTPYAASKAAGDHLVRTYAATFGVDAMVVRPFNNYGPRQNEKQYAGVIPTMVRCALEGHEFLIFGDGEQTRDYIYVTDTVRAALMLYTNPEARGQVVNIGSGREVSVLELKRQIEEILGQEIPTRHSDPRPGDVRRHLSDITQLQRLVHFEPRVALKDGLRETVTYYRDYFGL